MQQEEKLAMAEMEAMARMEECQSRQTCLRQTGLAEQAAAVPEPASEVSAALAGAGGQEPRIGIGSLPEAGITRIMD